VNEFQEELNVSSEDKIIIDKTRLLLALKKPHSVESVKNILREIEFVVEIQEQDIPSDNEIRSMELINHTDKLFWIRSSVGAPINQENLYRLKEVFGEEFDWIGPVYQPLSRQNDRGQLFCPFPNVLVIKLTAGFNDQDDEFVQRLARYNMKEITEKSKYLSGYRYYIIDNADNQNAY
jgi:DNA polymerase elongation subunit (family B)